ncbi:MAG: CADD family putative folate metabolism protein [Actinomycetota bacterium]
MTWTKKIDALVDEKHVLTHPFYVAWSKGELSIETLREYAKQYYNHVAAFPRYISAIHTQTEDLRARQYLLDNLNDEERGDENHPELWLRFAEALGCTRDDVRTADLLPETTACNETFKNITSSRGSIAGVAALYAYEAMIPAVSVSKIEGLRAFYGIDSDEALRFFDVHIEVDGWHADVARTLLAEATASEQEAALDAASESLDAINYLLDGVVRAYCPEVVTA